MAETGRNQSGATLPGCGKNYEIIQGDSGDKDKICVM